MANFIKKRLQVFVSSTYTDLIHERQAAVQAILTAGHIPAGMELFTSGDESQMEVIKQWINESDVYLLILGGRYGSVEPNSGKSYTHLEYEYAIAKGKPLFACVISDNTLSNRRAKPELVESDYGAKLKEFRAQVLSKMSKFWDDEKDIKIAVGETLSHFSRREDLIGWVRASEEVNMPSLLDEIARLSKENSELRHQITQGSVEETINGISFEDLKEILEEKNSLDFFEENRLAFATCRYVNVLAFKNGHELLSLGLIARIGDGYGLTDAGFNFLNKLAVQKLKHDA